MRLPGLSAIAGAWIVLLAIPAVSQAQRAQAVGITRSEAPTSMRHALRMESTAVVGSDTTQATASDTPHWAGAAIGAALGGFLGYNWYGGLCKGDNGCSGRHGAVGGVVIGGILGYLLGDAFEP
jgi:hypothetical protein